MNSEVSLIDFNQNIEKVCYNCTYRLNQIYKKEGTDAALSFLVDLTEMNAFVANILFRRFRYNLTQRQQETFQKATEDYFENFFKAYVLPAQSGIATVTSLHLKQYELTGKVMYRIKEQLQSVTRQKLYQGWCSKLLSTSYLNDEKTAAYFYYRFVCFGANESEKELFSFGKEIRFRDEIPELLKELVIKASHSRQYRYICSLLKVFPDISLNNLNMNLSDFIPPNHGSGPQIEYIIATYKLINGGKGNISLDAWYRTLHKNYNTKDHETSCGILDLLYLCRRISNEVTDPAIAIREYKCTPLPQSTQHNLYIKDAIEDASEVILKEYPNLIDRFINCLGENNIYRFDTYKEYRSSSGMTFSTSQLIVTNLQKMDFSNKHIIDIYMNSRLRSCYPFSIFIRTLYFNGDNIRNHSKKTLKDFSDYVFTGRVVFEEERKAFRIISYNFRNDLITVNISNNDMDYHTLSSMESHKTTVCFTLDQAMYIADKPGNIELRATILDETAREQVKLNRQYTSILSNNALRTELAKQNRSIDKMRYIYHEFANQNINDVQMKTNLNKDGSYASKSLPYQMNAQAEVFRAFKKLQSSPKLYTKALNTLKRTSMRFTPTMFLTEEMWKIFRENDGRAYRKDEMIDIYQQILGSDLNLGKKSTLYGNTIMRYLLPFAEAYDMMTEKGVPLSDQRYRFTGKLISHHDISKGKKMLLKVNHTLDPSETSDIVVYKENPRIEQNPQDGSYYIFTITSYSPSSRSLVSNTLYKLNSAEDEAETDAEIEEEAETKEE